MSGKEKRNNEARKDRRLTWIYRVLAAVVCLAMTGILVTVVSWLPRFGNGTNPAENEVYTRYVENGPEEAGAINTVADMILDYRAFDTLGESNVLLLAVCSVMILLRADRKRENGSPEIPELEEEQATAGKDSILRGAAVVLTPAGMIYGICMVMNGHLSAGGGFSGGAVIGAAMILYAAAFGPEKVERYLTRKAWHQLTLSALLVYTLLKTYSFYTGANGMENIIPLGTQGAILSGGLILPLNICVGVVVSCTMYALYALFRKGGWQDGR